MSYCTNVNDTPPDIDAGMSTGKIQSELDESSEPVSQRIAGIGRRTHALCERLPPEVIGLVFQRCLDGEKITLPICHDCSTVTMPWVLGQVCSRWRDILMGDSTIWSSLNISYENVRDREALTRRVEEIILPRIKLDQISLTCSNADLVGDNYSSIIPSLIMPNSARFRELSLSMTRVELEPLITSLPGLMKSLESLELIFTWADGSPRDNYDFHPLSITAFEDAPKLHKVHLSGRYFCEFKGTDPLNLPWSRLTDVNITLNLPYAAVVAFLPHCTQLVDCWLSVGSLDDRNNRDTVSGKITLPRLRSITLTSAYASTYACPKLLQSLILPALKKFALYLYDEGSVQNMLLALISRSTCQLERFTMTSYFDDALDNVAALLEAMPSLERLIIPRDYILPKSTITRMITGELVPALEAIHCQVDSLPLMLQLLESRKSGKSPGVLKSYKGIRCSVLWGHGMSECKCNN